MIVWEGVDDAQKRQHRCTFWRVAFFATLTSWACPQALAGEGVDSKLARLLTPDTFDAHLRTEAKINRPCLVMFHVAWCKVCQRSFPKFADASVMIEAKGIGMSLAHVDCTQEKTLCQRFEVKGYPTIKLFQPDGTDPRSYKGPRNEAQFVNYANRMTLPAVRSNIDTAAELAIAMREEAFVTFVAAVPAEDKLPAGLADVADTWMDRHVFVRVSKLESVLPSQLKPPADAKFVALAAGPHQWAGKDNTSDSPPAVAYFHGSLDDSAALSVWLEKNRFPGIWALTESSFFEFTHANRSTVIMAADLAKVTQEQENILRDAAKKFEKEFVFGVLDGISWSEEINDFNLARQDLPRVLITEENFDVWIEDIETLRMDSLESDLRAVLAGSSILRQDKGILSRFKFYGREARRLAVRIKIFGQKGPMQALLALVGCTASLLMVMCIAWALGVCAQAMFTDDEIDAKYAYKKYN